MRIPFLLLSITLPAVLIAQRSADQYLQLATTSYGSGTYEQALVQIDSAMYLGAASAGAFKLRGDIKQRLNDLDGALYDYAEAQKLDPLDVRLYISRAAARITGGNLKGAQKDLDRAVQLDPNDPDIFYNRACAKYLDGNNKGALRDAERAYKMKEDHAEALFLMGVVKGEEYREEAGLDDVEEALRMKPDMPGGMMSAAVLLYEMKRYEAAIERFGQVIEMNGEGKGEAYYYRGDCHYALGDKELACADWTISAGLGDKDAIFIKKNYCETDETKIPSKPVRKRRRSVIQF